MYHIELRSGSKSVRVFNRTEAELRDQFLAALVRGAPFTFEDNEWIPRETRMMIFEGPALPTHQLTMGRGWPNARKSGVDVTQAKLAEVGLGVGVGSGAGSRDGAGAGSGDEAGHALNVAAGSAARPASNVAAGSVTNSVTDLGANRILRERIIGRLSAGPIGLIDVVRVAASLDGGVRPSELLGEAELVVGQLIAGGDAALTVDGSLIADPARCEKLLGEIENWLAGGSRVSLVAG